MLFILSSCYAIWKIEQCNESCTDHFYNATEKN